MIVFAGPSLAGVEAPPGIEFRPPAKQGDLYLACDARPAAIGLVDGYFDGVPAVWHKEILWALAHGIPVLGASSMGALRAAELDRFGMVGVGAIYDAYRDGLYEDDDEVALHHAPAALGHAPLSVPMVNIRATLASAAAGTIVAESDAAAAIAAAKALHYGARNWDRVAGSLPREARHRFLDWLPGGEVDRKRLDALALLDRLRRGPPFAPSVPEVEPFVFQHTRLWRSASAQWRSAARGTGARRSAERIVDDDRLLR